MKLTCPACRATVSAEAWAEDENIKKFMGASAALPASVLSLAWRYVGLFRPRSGRGMSWARAARLVGELSVMCNASHVAWKGQPARPSAPAIWQAAIERITSRPPKDLPLSNHNYLRKIAWDLADQADQTRETAQNRAIAAGRNVHRASDAKPAGDIMSPTEIKASIEEFRKKRGRKP